MIFYEKYSEKVFNDIMIDTIIKSKGINEEEANLLLKEAIKDLSVDDILCQNNNCSSIRQGIIQRLINSGVKFKDFFKEGIESNYGLQKLTMNISERNEIFKYSICDLEDDIIAFGYDRDFVLAFREGLSMIKNNL